MARARNIKPSFFANDQLGELPPLARLLFIGLWGLADCKGKLEDRTKRIKAEVLPYDDRNVDELLNLLAPEFIVRYDFDSDKSQFTKKSRIMQLSTLYKCYKFVFIISHSEATSS